MRVLVKIWEGDELHALDFTGWTYFIEKQWVRFYQSGTRAQLIVRADAVHSIAESPETEQPEADTTNVVPLGTRDA